MMIPLVVAAALFGSTRLAKTNLPSSWVRVVPHLSNLKVILYLPLASETAEHPSKGSKMKKMPFPRH